MKETITNIASSEFLARVLSLTELRKLYPGIDFFPVNVSSSQIMDSVKNTCTEKEEKVMNDAKACISPQECYVKSIFVFDCSPKRRMAVVKCRLFTVSVNKVYWEPHFISIQMDGEEKKDVVYSAGVTATFHSVINNQGISENPCEKIFANQPPLNKMEFLYEGEEEKKEEEKGVLQ